MNTNKFEKKIKKYRNKIDKVDNEIIKLIWSRFQACKNIATLKKKTGQPIYQVKRHQNVINKRVQEAIHYTLNPKFITNLFELIMQESCSIQKLSIK